MRRVCLLALPSVFDSAWAIARDILSVGRQAAGAPSPTTDFEIVLVSLAGDPVTTAGGLQVLPDAALDAVDADDWLLIPGFSVPGEEDVSSILAYLDRPTIRSSLERLQQHRQAGGAIAAGCTATFVLAEAGVLDGLQATTSWWLADFFAERYPAVDLQAHMMLTVHDRVTCAGAALAHTDLALWLLGQLRGPATADFVARRLLLDERVSQARYMATEHVRRHHPVVSRAEAWVRARIAEPIRIDELASALALSPRTLARRFHEATGESPLAFIQRLRADHAVHLLETSTFDEIAARVGYQEPAGLRRVLKRRTGKSPSALRQTAS